LIYYVRDKPGSLKDLDSSCQYKKRTVLTWAPSHPETALLSELLHWANIINGFKLPIKLSLRRFLEIMLPYEIGTNEDENFLEGFVILEEEISCKKMLFGVETHEKKILSFVFCFELCNEYFDYLKRIIKPYM
jgi:hypothetical protein